MVADGNDRLWLTAADVNSAFAVVSAAKIAAIARRNWIVC